MCFYRGEGGEKWIVVTRCHVSCGRSVDPTGRHFSHTSCKRNEGGAGFDKDGWTWHHDHIRLCWLPNVNLSTATTVLLSNLSFLHPHPRPTSLGILLLTSLYRFPVLPGGKRTKALCTCSNMMKHMHAQVVYKFLCLVYVSLSQNWGPPNPTILQFF